MRPLPKIIISGWLTFVTCWVWGVQGAQSVSLAWNPDPNANLAGYRLYCGTTRGVYTQRIEVGKTTTISISNLAAGRTYFFAVTVYNTAYMESAPSNEVSYTVPASTPTLTRTSTSIPAPTRTPAFSPPRISISVSPTKINEGGDATFTVSASTINPFQATTVHYSIRGKAQYGTDYTLSGIFAQVDIPTGASSASVVLHALTDSVMEKKPEKATIKLSKAAAYRLPSGKKAKATVSIANVQPTPAPASSP
jgi:hypothetical protein